MTRLNHFRCHRSMMMVFVNCLLSIHSDKIGAITCLSKLRARKLPILKTCRVVRATKDSDFASAVVSIKITFYRKAEKNISECLAFGAVIQLYQSSERKERSLFLLLPTYFMRNLLLCLVQCQQSHQINYIVTLPVVVTAKKS